MVDFLIPRKPLVRTCGCKTGCFPWKPAGPLVRKGIAFRKVRLDIKQGSPVQHIYTPDIQTVPISPGEGNDGKTNRIRAVGSPRRKDSVRVGIKQEKESPEVGSCLTRGSDK